MLTKRSRKPILVFEPGRWDDGGGTDGKSTKVRILRSAAEQMMREALDASRKTLE
jgi:hypothetical protein